MFSIERIRYLACGAVILALFDISFASVPKCPFQGKAKETGFSEGEKSDILAQHNTYRRLIRDGEIKELLVFV